MSKKHCEQSFSQKVEIFQLYKVPGDNTDLNLKMQGKSFL